MCSVRQSPMPAAPNARATSASRGVSALARTLRSASPSAQPKSVRKADGKLRLNDRHASGINLPGRAVEGHHVSYAKYLSLPGLEPGAAPRRMRSPAAPTTHGSPMVRGNDGRWLVMPPVVVRIPRQS